MPHIPEVAKNEVMFERAPESTGELTWLLTEVLIAYIQAKGGVRWSVINDCLGSLDGAAREFYRQVAAPYEDAKAEENGNAYARL